MRILFALPLLLALAAPAAAQSVAPAVKRTPLQKVEFPGTHDTIMGTAELPAGMAIGRHTHPGVEIGYVLDGEAVLSIEGEPDRVIKAGDSYQVPAGKPHDAKASANGPAKVLAVWAVERGKPLATPHPQH